MSQYAKRIAKLGARIFGEVSYPTHSRSMRVVKLFSEKPLQVSPEVYEYYPRHNEMHHLFRHLRNLGLYRDEHKDFTDEMKRLRRLKGKVKPKKGEGKRAMKKK